MTHRTYARRRFPLFAALVASSLLTTTSPALAQTEEPFRHVALTANPFTLLGMLRVGVNVEYLPIAHHGIILNPYFTSWSVGFGSAKTWLRYGGFELGYHFYSGHKGANGFFAGPSFVFNSGSVGTEFDDESDKVSLNSYGVAFDFGGQHVFDGGITVGGGAGLMHLKSSAKAKDDAFVKFDGTWPRVLLTFGYSF